MKPKGRESADFYLSDIALIESLKNKGNHIVYFLNQKPIETVNSTFEDFRLKGFAEDKFYKFGKSYLINIAHSAYKDDSILIQCICKDGNRITYPIRVLPDKRKEVRTILSR